jgi:hypothetical protein
MRIRETAGCQAARDVRARSQIRWDFAARLSIAMPEIVEMRVGDLRGAEDHGAASGSRK